MAEGFDLEAFQRDLQKCSDDIKREVAALIPAAADEFAQTIIARYPLGKKAHPDRPHMRQDVRMGSLLTQDALIPGKRVFGPRLAYIWQDGTAQRYDSTRNNANRGRMPVGDKGFFQRTAIHVRASMLRLAQGILDKPRKID